MFREAHLFQWAVISTETCDLPRFWEYLAIEFTTYIIPFTIKSSISIMEEGAGRLKEPQDKDFYETDLIFTKKCTNKFTVSLVICTRCVYFNYHIWIDGWVDHKPLPLLKASKSCNCFMLFGFFYSLWLCVVCVGVAAIRILERWPHLYMYAQLIITNKENIILKESCVGE